MALVSTEEGAARLEVLIAGLLFVSESDSPLRVVRFGSVPELDERAFSRMVATPAGTPIAQQPLGVLFDRTTTEQPWHGPAERVTVERYRALVDFLTRALDDARAFRVGKIEVAAYAVGKTRDGEWLGVATTLVET